MERSTAQSIYGGAATEVTAPPWDITHPGEPAQLDGIGQNAKAEDFRMKNKAYEIIRYGNIALKDFPRYERYALAADIRQSMYAILRLVIMLENKHYKKTTLGELDTEVDVLRHLIRLAADADMYPGKKPCLPFRKYENWAKLINQLGGMIGNYEKFVNSSNLQKSGKRGG